jgi:hypothetical protein
MISLVSPKKSASAERARTRIVSPTSAKGACTRPSGKCPSSEGNLGCHGLVGTLPAKIIQQCVDALMIALYCCAWPV